MNYKSILKGVSFALLASQVFAQELSGDCKDIETYLSEKSLEYSSTILDCDVNSSGQVKNLKILDLGLSEEVVKKLLSYQTVTEFYYGVFDVNGDGANFSGFPKDITKLPNLEELGLSYTGLSETAKSTIAVNTLNVSKTLKRMILGGIELSQSNINEISALSNLEELNLVYCSYDNLDFDSLNKLSKLTTLEMDGHSNYQLKQIPNFIFSLSKLKSLILTGHAISTISDKLANLKNLEYLDLSLNEINAEIPESLNTLSKLKYVDFKGNKDVKGKTLTNDSLEHCYYHKSYSLCQAKAMSCFEENVSFESCGSSSGEPISTNGLCGNGNGNCLAGECCSKYGYCGHSDDHCKVSKGCQSAFGSCINDTITTVPPKTTTTTTTTTTSSPTPTSVKDRCGKGIGSCAAGKCCSKYGWCGTSEKHCSVSQGCQSEFGTCTGDIPISTNDKCGPKDGRCPAGKCCSKYGWCGISEKHCSISQGCQSEFGQCNQNSTTTTKTTTTKTPSPTTTKISTNGKCGKNDGVCPKGECCSKYGWCGHSTDHCSVKKGCQSAFGSCNNDDSASTVISTNGKCGKEHGRCPNGYCCSKYGWCGTSSAHCGSGCQSEFGTCN